MSFLAPSLLFGLGFIALPIAVHLIGRRRAPTLAFSAYDFLAEVVERLARREQIRQLLLLLLRILIVALLAFALAGPGLQRAAVATELTDTLIVLDASRSMTYTLNGETLLQKAKARTNKLLGERAEGLALVVV